jgi:hypothetical protein
MGTQKGGTIMEFTESGQFEEEYASGGTQCDPEGFDFANYRPGMLAEAEDRLNEARDRAFEYEFFSFGC